MSEMVIQSADDQVTSADAIAPMSAGAMLRKAREAAGLHIAALAVSLNVSVKKLEALEADRLDLLPDAVFVRGLASSICRALKIDPGPVLERLPQTTAPRLKPDESGINAPFRAPGERAGLSMRDQLSRPVVLAALVLLVGALVLIFFPAVERTESSGKASPDGVIVAAPVAMMASAPQPFAAGQLVDVQAPMAVPFNGSGLTPVPGTGATSGMVVFKARGASWVEVTDASGVVQLRKTMVAGETAGASGAPPLAVVVGRADATDVQVRGQPFDLASVAKDNVARFEVK